MEIDLNDVDDPKNVLDPEVHQELYQQEMVNIIQKNIKDQYENLNNLGQNYYLMFKDNLRESDKVYIFTDLFEYVNKNLISISDLDNLSGNIERTLIAGPYIYEFICVDNYASLIPAFMESLNITTVDELDHLINTKYLDNPSSFKTDYVKMVQTTIEQLLKLQRITPEVNKDEKYQRLLGKYYYIQELVDYGDTELFLENYIRPILSKYHADFIWKLLG